VNTNMPFFSVKLTLVVAYYQASKPNSTPARRLTITDDEYSYI